MTQFICKITGSRLLYKEDKIVGSNYVALVKKKKERKRKKEKKEKRRRCHNFKTYKLLVIKFELWKQTFSFLILKIKLEFS